MTTLNQPSNEACNRCGTQLITTNHDVTFVECPDCGQSTLALHRVWEKLCTPEERLVLCAIALFDDGFGWDNMNRDVLKRMTGLPNFKLDEYLVSLTNAKMIKEVDGCYTTKGMI